MPALAAPSSEAIDAARTAGAGDAALQVRAAMLRYLYDAGRQSRLAGMALLLAVSAFSLLRLAPGSWLPWLALAVAMIVLRSLWLRQYMALPREQADAELPRWERRAVIGALATGTVWAVAVGICFDAGDLLSQVFVLGFAGLVAMVSMGGAAALRPAYVAQGTPGLLAAAVAFAAIGTLEALIVGALVALAVPAFVGLARQHERLLRQSFAIRHERELLLATLRERTREAEAASASKTRFLASASHDLRQPLHALGLLTAGLEQAVGGAGAARLQPIRQVLQSLDELIDSLLDISRLDVGDDAAAPLAPVALQPLFDRLGTEFDALAAERGLQLRCRPTPLAVLSDATSLERMLRNLLSNALRYTERGGVLLAARRRGGQVQLAVWDSGTGIPQAQQQAVFDEFVQLANPGRDRALGLGLGLAIVRRLALRLQHAVTLRSRPGRGSCFAISAPAAPLPAAAGADPALPPLPSEPLAGLTVALVEDDIAVRGATHQLLAQWGMAVHAGACADEVLALLAGRVPDLIVSDWRLPQGDGLQAIAALRAASGRAVPALLLSGDALPPAALAAGDIGCARKPVPPARLRLLVSDRLRGAAAG